MNERELWGPWYGNPPSEPTPGLTVDQRRALKRWAILGLCAIGGLVAGFILATGAAING